MIREILSTYVAFAAVLVSIFVITEETPFIVYSEFFSFFYIEGLYPSLNAQPSGNKGLSGILNR
jgi:hypothetical protein